MGPAELLDHDRKRLRGLIVEDGSGQSHVAIVAKALGIAAVGHRRKSDRRCDDRRGAPASLHHDVIAAYSIRSVPARRQRQYRALRDVPAVTTDGVKADLQINAGLLVDMPHLKDAGADGGLFRTELLFMLSNTLPKVERRRIPPRHRGARRRQTGGLPHARYRRRQGPPLPTPGKRTRPSAWGSIGRPCCAPRCGRSCALPPARSCASDSHGLDGHGNGRGACAVDKERKIMRARVKKVAGAMIEVPTAL